MDMYAEEIISHYEYPHNKGRMERPSASFHDNNPLCGDDMTIYLKISGQKISEAMFDGSGCAISMASASMLTDEVKGKSLAEVGEMDARSIISMLGIDPGPARLKCATLSLRTLKEALLSYRKMPADGSVREL